MIGADGARREEFCPDCMPGSKGKFDMTPKPEGDDYTLTSASDWPMVLILGGLLTAIIAGMWVDLKSTIRESRTEWREALREHVVTSDKETDKIWTAIKECNDNYRAQRGDE